MGPRVSIGMRPGVASETGTHRRCNRRATGGADRVRTEERAFLRLERVHMSAPVSQIRPRSKLSAGRAVALHAAIVLASVFAASVILVGCGPDASHAQEAGPGANGPPPAAVAVLTLAAASVAKDYEYVGQTAGSRDVEVRARVPGILLKRNFAEGGTVRQGQSLYSLDPAPFQAALKRADADVAAAEARVAQATRTLNRLKPLWEARAVSQREHDDAASAEQVARADVLGARARRDEAALNLGYTKVEAPLSGAAGRSQVSEGTLVAGPGTLLTTLTQTDPMKVRFGIADTDQMKWRNEAAAGQLQLPAHGAFTVEIKLADGSVYPHQGKLAVLRYAGVRRHRHGRGRGRGAQPRRRAQARPIRARALDGRGEAPGARGARARRARRAAGQLRLRGGRRQGRAETGAGRRPARRSAGSSTPASCRATR